MRKTAIILLAVVVTACACDAHAQLKSGSQRQQYRDAVELQDRTDHTGAQQMREDRRDMLREGAPLDQIQLQETEQIQNRHTAPQPDFSGDAQVGGTYNSPFMGVSSPKKGEESQK